MRYWVFTTKPNHFRMSEALIPGETLDWPTFSRFKFEVGDLVFFYASSPVLQMIGKLEIETIGLEFSEVNPRNDLRKWPKRHSYIPWMRLRVLQSAPIPFKPLQRGSLYYHTEFKPSPYPKLLHEGEIDYVMRAFDEAMTFTAEKIEYPDGLNPVALGRATGGDLLKATAEQLKGSHIDSMVFDCKNDTLKVTLGRDRELNDTLLTLTFGGVVQSNWQFEKADYIISGIRLTVDDTYLKTNLDGADLEIFSNSMRVD